MTDVRPVRPEDHAEWVRLRRAMWPDADHERDTGRFFSGDRREPAEVLLAIDGDGRAVGFAELSIRNIVDSCSTDRVAYLEGWYVEPGVRRQGIGGALVAAAERWARSQGCREFASDTEPENETSQLAHRALGFTETGRSVQFRKDL